MKKPDEYEILERAHQAAGAHMMQKSPRADELIACLEGEIAKRDEELAACRVAVENCEVFRARIAELERQLGNSRVSLKDSDAGLLSFMDQCKQLRAELAAIKAQESVAHDTKGSRKALGAMNAKLKAKIGRLERELAAPAAKPQVVIPELDREGFEDEYSGEYGTPVSVLRLLRDGENYIEKPQHSDRLNSSWWMWKVTLSRLNAAPAAPAADAGIVDMYRHLQKVTPYRFKKIQDASITDGGDVMYFHKDRFDAALLADMAAHCAARGVV